jgi:deoxyribonuclease-4
MLRLGAHESIAGGLYKAIERGESVGCESLQVWTKNSRQWQAKPLGDEEVEAFRSAAASSSLHPIVAHASYLINLASPKGDLHRRSVRALVDEARRCDQLGIPYLVLHPGAHTGSGPEEGRQAVARAVDALNEALPDRQTRVLLETTAGQGTALGGTFEELAMLLGDSPKERGLGVCLDTCHIFAAGYDIATASGYASVVAGVQDTVGLDNVYVIHLNDSRYELGSGKDRHAHIGEGEIGLAGFQHVLLDERWDGLPGILETPKSDDLHEDKENLSRLRELVDDGAAAAPHTLEQAPRSQ